MVEFAKIMLLSTGHVPAHIAHEIDQDIFPLTSTSRNEYGWVFQIPCMIDGLSHVLTDEAFAIFKPIFEKAHNEECLYIQFDRDIDPDDSLPFYEW